MTKTSFAPDILASRLAVTSKKQLLQTLSSRIARHGGLCERAVMTAILTREKLGGTGLGDGVALPHATLPQLTRSITLVASLDSAVEFDAPDGMPVDLVALVLGCQDNSHSYLAAITACSRLLRARGNALRSASNEEAMRNILSPPLEVAA